MPVNINSVSVTFENGVKREEYGPTKKAAVTISAAVAENEDGALVLAAISHFALTGVANLLAAPKPETETASTVVVPAGSPVAEATASEPPKLRTRRTKEQIAADEAAKTTGAEPAAGAPAIEAPTAETQAPSEDEWETAEAAEITDQQLLTATSARAQAINGREPILKLIGTFSTRTEGPAFKVQEIPQNQRQDYLDKLAALTA